MQRPIKITIKFYSDDGKKSWLVKSETASFANVKNAEKRYKVILDRLLRNPENNCFGIVLEDNINFFRSEIINSKWYL